MKQQEHGNSLGQCSEIIQSSNSFLDLLEDNEIGKILNEINQNDKNDFQVFCYQGNKMLRLCVNPTCSKPAIMCQKENCSCHQMHQEEYLCETISADLALKKIMKKKINIPGLSALIKKNVQSLIKQTVKLEEKLNYSLQNILLAPLQRQFLKLLENKQYQKLTGHNLAQIQKKINTKFQKIDTQQLFNQLDQKIGRIFQQIKGVIGKVDEFIYQFQRENISINAGLSLRPQSSLARIDSQIIKSHDQYTDLLHLFSFKRVSQLKLLYRASQNNFLTKQFHTKCDNVPSTVVLVKTQYGKIIGGYTPIPWTSNKGRRADPFKQTFIFSLTNKDKILLQKQSQAVTHQADKGPVFGDNKGFWIYDEANKTRKSNVSFSCYHHPNYKGQCQDSYKRFIGGNGLDHNFSILEWQVYEVKFEEELRKNY